MEQFKVTYSDNAIEDLDDIYLHISQNLKAEQAARNVFKRIKTAIRSLDYMPERFRVYDKEPWRSRNMRVMSVDNYLVFYTADIGDRAVNVFRIIYGGRDTDKALSQK